MSLPKHHYVRQFDTASADSLAQLSEWIPAGSTVLELGPAEGYFTRHMNETRQCVIDAVEIDYEMAQKARPWCRQLVEGDLENMALADIFPAHAYDVIVLADVLEHLRFPERLLRQLTGLLKAGGVCLVSVPNVAYGGLIVELLEGRFDYRNEGLLDRTHLRFFTQHSLAALFDETGLYPWEWRSVTRPFFESEFRTRLEVLPTALTSLLDSQPTLHYYQWLVKVRPIAPETAPALSDKPFSERFPVRLFWSDGEASFDYSRSQIAWGTVGAERQSIRFVLPQEGRAKQLRLRLADRPGFVRLYSIGVLDEAGAVCWRWTADFGSLALGKAMGEMSCADAGPYTVASLHGTESWLNLPWVKDGEGAASTVLIDLGWPMSPDFEAARQGLARTLIPLQMEMNAVKALVCTRDVELATRDATLASRDAEIAECGRLIAGRDAAIAERDDALSRLHVDLAMQCAALGAQHATTAEQAAQITTLNSEIARMRSFSWWLRRTLDWPGRAVQRLRNL